MVFRPPSRKMWSQNAENVICKTFLLFFQTQNSPILMVEFLRSNLNHQLELIFGQFFDENIIGLIKYFRILFYLESQRMQIVVIICCLEGSSL